MADKNKRRRYEALCFAGLDEYLKEELYGLPGIKFRDRDQKPGLVSFSYYGEMKEFSSLRVAREVRWIIHFDVPRPKALLGHQTLTQLIASIREVTDQYPKRRFKRFTFSAAGNDTDVMQRLRSEISNQTGLTSVPESGDLSLGLRRDRSGQGWELWIRTSPRPLSVRAWRKINYPGGLNGTLAAVMGRMLDPAEDHRILNLMCGSGSIMAEIESMYRLRDETHLMVGGDIEPDALFAALANLNAANSIRPLIRLDAVLNPFCDEAFDVILSDLPWGQLIGSNADVEAIYPAIFEEAYRLLKPNGRFVVMTQAIRAVNQMFDLYRDQWHMHEQLRIREKNYTPRIYLLEKLSGED